MCEISVFAPASIGNIGPAFDNLGVAVEAIGDVVSVGLNGHNQMIIDHIEGDDSIPLNPRENVASIAADQVLQTLGIKSGMSISIKKGIPAGSGLGSSAASAVAAGYATNLLFGNKLSKEELVTPITRAEETVSGAYFCDNTASSLLGGVILSRSYETFEVLKLGHITNAWFALVKPAITILTKRAREILPKSVPLANFITNNANSCGIVASVFMKDVHLFGRSIDDRVVEPFRARLIPGFEKVKKAAMKAGALGCAISGSGPTVFAVCQDEDTSRFVAGAMRDAFRGSQIDSQTFITKMDTEGAREVEI